MPQGGWLTSLREQAGAEIPAGLRLIAGAASGAALSLSYTGQYRQCLFLGLCWDSSFLAFWRPASRGFRVRISSTGFFSF